MMVDLRKAAEMALKTLDSLDLHDGQLWFSECDPEWFDSVTTALRQALAQHECSRSHPHENMDSMCELRTENARLTNENARLKKALAQPEQEPVAWLVQYKDRHEFVWGAKPEFRGDTVFGLEPLYTAPYTKTDNPDKVLHKEWVGLTDEQIYQHEWWDEETAFAVNKELKEKNCG
jgi:hypothetical protein